MNRAAARSLHELPIFSHLSKRELARADSLVTQVSLPAGAVLCQEDAYGREAFVILSGTVTVSHGDDVIATLGHGSVVGEIALLGDGRRTATVTAAEPVEALVMNMTEFQSLRGMSGVDDELHIHLP
jgi:CRP-like cAMP-binding protein